MTDLVKAWHRVEAQRAKSEHRMATMDAFTGTAHAIAAAAEWDVRDVCAWTWWAMGAAKDAVVWRALQAWHERGAR